MGDWVGRVRNRVRERSHRFVALEPGAATSIQMQALEDFRKLAATKWPNIKVLFEWVP